MPGCAAWTLRMPPGKPRDCPKSGHILYDKGNVKGWGQTEKTYLL